MGSQYRRDSQLKEKPLWGEHERPSRDLCAVCGKKVSEQDRIVEQRPTGKAGRLQAWPYCTSCAPVNQPAGRRIG
jgi:hypothetical protein